MRPCSLNSPVKRGIGVDHNFRRSRRARQPEFGKILRGDSAIIWILGEDGPVSSCIGQVPDDLFELFLSQKRDEQDRSAAFTHASDGRRETGGSRCIVGPIDDDCRMPGEHFATGRQVNLLERIAEGRSI